MAQRRLTGPYVQSLSLDATLNLCGAMWSTSRPCTFNLTPLHGPESGLGARRTTGPDYRDAHWRYGRGAAVRLHKAGPQRVALHLEVPCSFSRMLPTGQS